MDELNTVKVIVLILLALIKLGSGLLPVLLDKVLQVKKVHIFLNYILYIPILLKYLEYLVNRLHVYVILISL